MKFLLVIALLYLLLSKDDEPKPTKPDYAAMRTPGRMPL